MIQHRSKSVNPRSPSRVQTISLPTLSTGLRKPTATPTAGKLLPRDNINLYVPIALFVLLLPQVQLVAIARSPLQEQAALIQAFPKLATASSSIYSSNNITSIWRRALLKGHHYRLGPPLRNTMIIGQVASLSSSRQGNSRSSDISQNQCIVHVTN